MNTYMTRILIQYGDNQYNAKYNTTRILQYKYMTRILIQHGNNQYNAIHLRPM